MYILEVELELLAHGDHGDNADSLWIGELPSAHITPKRGKKHMLAVIDGPGLSGERIVANEKEAIAFFVEELSGYDGWKKKDLVRVK